MFVDLKDFTGQAATLSRSKLLALLRRQRGVVEKAVTPHGGTIVKTMGDGMIVTFESATNAVLAGLAIVAGARKGGLELRVGITTGEVTLEEADVYGPAVNVAARLQAAANVGDVYFSEATRHAIHTAEIAAEDLGMMELKGVPERVRVYCAREGRSI
jgi:class 3 adenylate cyclase